MATAALSSDESEANQDDQHLEIFGLIWLDPNAAVKETRDTEQKLRSIINYLKKFQNIEECQQYIKQRSQKDRLVLIVSGRLGREIVPSIHKFRQIISIYVYCMDKKENEEWVSKFPKIKAVVAELNELFFKISADHKIQKKVEEPLSINVFTTNSGGGKSTTGVNGQFVFSQVLIDCLLQLKSTQIDKNELMDCCKNEYEGNDTEVQNLEEFEQDYSSNKALWWYTRESFFYKTLNSALRTQNIHMIFLFRAFIFDIHTQLEKYQSKNSLHVYRSQLMSSDEIDNLIKYTGQFISVNSFFSTSKERKTALFLLGDTTLSIDLERVLFEIDANPKIVTTKSFADISEYSDFPDESEVLFMIGSIFLLESINRDSDQIWIIRMTLCSDDEHGLKKVLMYMKQQLGSGDTNLRILAKVLWKMGKLDLAEQYFNRLLKQLSPNDPLLSNVYEDLGELAALREDYDKSMQWHQKSLAIKNKDEIPISPIISSTNNTIEERIISSSSFSININTKWKQYGITIAGGNNRGNRLNQLSSPYGIYVDDNNQAIYTADFFNHRIIEWKSNENNGQVVAGGNEKGNEMNQLNWPRDVVVDEKNNSFIICDQGNRRVVRWSHQNNTNGEIIISNIDCRSLTIDNNENIYVSDCKKNEVKRWKIGDQNGVIVAGGNGQGNNLNQLNFPTSLFVDEYHSVYVSDLHNHRVMKWMKNAKEGIIVAGGHDQGNSLTQLSNPQGVFVDQCENVYMADAGNDRIMRWSKGSKEGSIVIGGNGEGNQSDQLNGPMGLSFDRQGNLYVVDWGNNRVPKVVID